METGKVIEAAIAYFENDIRRISHLLKVYGFAKAIGEKEQLDYLQWNVWKPRQCFIISALKYQRKNVNPVQESIRNWRDHRWLL